MKKIIIYTNGKFSIKILKYLINYYNITGIVTNKLNYKKKNYIYKFIKKNKINYFFDKNINNKKKILTFLKKKKPDLQIIISFKYIKKYIFNFPKYGSINIHPSLLPLYYGANPIRYTILNNEKYTGITIIKINNIIDKGKILIQKKIKIFKKDSYNDLFNKLSYFCIFILKKILYKIFFKKKINIHHIKKKKKKSYKTYHKNGKINWNNNCLNIYNKIKAFYKKPLCWTNLVLINNNKKKIIIKKSNYKLCIHKKKNGFIIINKKFIKIFCKNGYINVIKLKFNNKKQNNIKKFINGIINLKILKCI